MKQKVIEQFAKPFFDVYQKEVSSALAGALAKLKSPAKQRKVLSKIEKFQKIKTIWHTDRPLLLSSVYYPTSIESQYFPAKPIKCLAELPTNFSLFFGTAGQGKSVLLKHLIEGEIVYSTNIPLFIEIRDYKGSNFIEYIFKFFKDLFEDIDFDIFKVFCDQGKISFLIDGFDEIDDAHQEASLNGINNLSEKYPLCKIALTSRPDYPCEFLQNFNNYKIKPLEIGDLDGFYKKLTRDKVFTSKLFQAITTSPTEIKGLVKTPLLATLLAISYKSAQKIPLEFSEFYEQLFQILLIRHDGAKLGWHRERKSKLTDDEMQRVFESLCFKSRKINSLVFDKPSFYGLAKQAIESTLITCKESDYVNDISKITCLVISEATGYSFVHGSVPEFFSAKYVKGLSERKSIEFYKKILNGSWRRWRSEILFLEQIDNFRFIKHFEMPDIFNALNIISPKKTVTSIDVMDFLKSITINKVLDDGEKSGTPRSRYSYNHPRVNSGYSFWNLINRSVMLCTSGSGYSWTYLFNINKDLKIANLLEIVSQYPDSKQKEIYDLIENAINGLSEKSVLHAKKNYNLGRGFGV